MSMTPGGRNLAILGCGAIVLAFVTTAVSLAMYRNSGDIYLDRSRPGYLPDKEEAEDDHDIDSGFTFAETGPLTAEDLDTYLEVLHATNSRLHSIAAPYAPEPLSDESLGIPSEFDETPDAPLFTDAEDLL